LQENSYRKPKPKSTNLKLVTTKPDDLRLGGVAPSEEMKPGKHLVVCEAAWIEPVGKQHRCVLQYRVVDSKHDGVGLRQRITAANGGGIISPTGRYARHCAIALGRPLEPDDPVGDPEQIFAGRKFVVFAGYRKTEHAKGGRSSDDRALARKDAADFFRVHEIISRENI
jgi:hypothetical protein